LTGPGGPVRLHEVIAHTGHTVLATTGEGDRANSDDVVKTARHVADRFGPHVKAFVVARMANATTSAADMLIDPAGAAHARLGGDAPSLCVVRPDGHLGLRVTPPARSAVDAYFARIFA
jgi:hypothetical protein